MSKASNGFLAEWVSFFSGSLPDSQITKNFWSNDDVAALRTEYSKRAGLGPAFMPTSFLNMPKLAPKFRSNSFDPRCQGSFENVHKCQEESNQAAYIMEKKHAHGNGLLTPEEFIDAQREADRAAMTELDAQEDERDAMNIDNWQKRLDEQAPLPDEYPKESWADENEGAIPNGLNGPIQPAPNNIYELLEKEVSREDGYGFGNSCGNGDPCANDRHEGWARGRTSMRVPPNRMEQALKAKQKPIDPAVLAAAGEDAFAYQVRENIKGEERRLTPGGLSPLFSL